MNPLSKNRKEPRNRVAAVATGSALVRKAKKRARLANLVNDADREFGESLEARYGWEGNELPDSLVEIIDYGNAPSFTITLKWLDEEMATIGFTPLPNTRGEPDGRSPKA